MKYFKNYQMFTEAIDIQDVRKYLTIKRKKSVTNLLNQIFKRLKELPGAESSKRDERIYIPFEGISDKIEKGPIQQEIEDFFSPQGIEIVDYTKGLAREGRRSMKIGKFLVKLKRQDLLKKYNNDLQREGARIEDSYIVFSRHAYDIAGMSTGRGWNSCMNIHEGDYKQYVQYDISEGTIVAYLIHGKDKNINKPIARIAIKPYINRDDSEDVIYFSEDAYPSSTNPNFKVQVGKILEKIQKIKNLASYQLNKDLYCDSRPSIFINKNSRESLNYEEIKYTLDFYNIKNYIINENLTIDVNGNVVLIRKDLKEIPVNFNYVSGDFNCSFNKLTSLQGCPKKVGGDFYCVSNKLTTLEGAPELVEGEFNASSNQLTSLQGAPKELGGYFACSSNQLTSLQGAPKELGTHFDCSRNQLTSLQGAPKELGGYFDCSFNQLTSLQGGPKEVDGDFDCSRNQLTSLQGGPKKVDGKFNASHNQLISLQGGPKEVDGDFDCYNNKIKFTKDEVIAISNVNGEIIV